MRWRKTLLHWLEIVNSSPCLWVGTQDLGPCHWKWVTDFRACGCIMFPSLVQRGCSGSQLNFLASQFTHSLYFPIFSWWLTVLLNSNEDNLSHLGDQLVLQVLASSLSLPTWASKLAGVPKNGRDQVCGDSEWPQNCHQHFCNLWEEPQAQAACRHAHRAPSDTLYHTKVAEILLGSENHGGGTVPDLASLEKFLCLQ